MERRNDNSSIRRLLSIPLVLKLARLVRKSRQIHHREEDDDS
jgi:hypothetical protein